MIRFIYLLTVICCLAIIFCPAVEAGEDVDPEFWYIGLASVDAYGYVAEAQYAGYQRQPIMRGNGPVTVTFPVNNGETELATMWQVFTKRAGGWRLYEAPIGGTIYMNYHTQTVLTINIPITPAPESYMIGTPIGPITRP